MAYQGPRLFGRQIYPHEIEFFTQYVADRGKGQVFVDGELARGNDFSQVTDLTNEDRHLQRMILDGLTYKDGDLPKGTRVFYYSLEGHGLKKGKNHFYRNRLFGMSVVMGNVERITEVRGVANTTKKTFSDAHFVKNKKIFTQNL